MAGQKFPEVGLRAVFEITGFQKSYNQYQTVMRDIDKATSQTANKVNQTTQKMAGDIAKSFNEFARKSSIVQDVYDNLRPTAQIAEMQRLGEAFTDLGRKASVNVPVFDHLVNSGLSFAQAMQVAGGRINIDIAAFDKLIQRGVDADEAFRRLTSGVGDASQTVTIFGRQFTQVAVATAAVTAAFGAAISLVRQSISAYSDLAEATRQLRDQTGILSREASQYVQAFTATGLSSTSAARGMAQFQNKVVDLNRDLKSGKENTSDFAVAMKFLDVSIVDSQGNLKPTAQLLNEVNEAFQRLGPGARTAEAAQSLFGIAAYKLLPLLTDQRVTLQELIGITDRYGSSLNALSQQEYADFVIAQFELRSAVQGVFNFIAKNWVPVLTQVERIMANSISIYRQVAQSVFGLENANRPLLDILTLVADKLDELNRSLETMGVALNTALFIMNPFHTGLSNASQSAEGLAEAEEKAAQAGFDLAQSAADVSSALDEQLRALDKLKSQLNQKLADINADAARGWDDILVKRQREAFDRSLQNVYKMDDLRRALNEKLDDIERDFAKRWDDILVKRQREAWERALREGWQDLDLIRRRDQSRADAIRDAGERERQIYKDYRNKLREAEEDARKKREELERDHLRRLRDIQQDYYDTVSEAARQNDAVAVARAIRERARAIRDEEQRYQDEQTDLEESLKEKRRQIEIDRREREREHQEELARTLQRIQENYQRQVEELALQRERERIIRAQQEAWEKEDFDKAKAAQQQAAQEWYDRQLEEMERQAAREAQLRAIQYEREEIDFVKNWQRRIDDAQQWYERERDELAAQLEMTGEMLEAAYAEWARMAAEAARGLVDPLINEINRLNQALGIIGGRVPEAVRPATRPAAAVPRAPQRPFGVGPGMAEGGVLQASRPTMVTMGEGGPETAVFMPGRANSLNVNHSFGRLGVDFQGIPGGMNTQQVQAIVYAVVTQLAKGIQIPR